MRTQKLASALAFVGLWGVALAPVCAQTTTYYGGNDATYTINTSITSFNVVGFANQNDFFNGQRNPTSPTVNVVSGGIVFGDMTAYNGSKVNITGGVIAGPVAALNDSLVTIAGRSSSTGDVSAYDRSKVNISGQFTNVTSVSAHQNSTVAISSGNFGSVSVYDSATLNYSGGTVGAGLFANGQSKVAVSGGTLSNLASSGGSTLKVTNGDVNGLLSAGGSSTLSVSGGSFNNSLTALDSSTVHFSNGVVGRNLEVSGNSTVSLSGGRFGGDLFMQDTSTVNLSGGEFSGFLYVNGSALNLYGTNLTTQLLSTQALFGNYTMYSLSGTLLDGTELKDKLLFTRNGTDARFTIVPGPAALGLFASGTLGLIGLLIRRRK